MKKIIINKKRILIIMGIMIGLFILAFILGMSLKNVLITALTGGMFTFVSTGEVKIKKNKEKLNKMKEDFDKREKDILNTDYNIYGLAYDPANQYISKRIQSRSNKRNNK